MSTSPAPTVSHPPSEALADPAAVVAGDTWRVTVLTDGLLRLEHSPDGGFEDRPSTFAVRRRLPVPEFRVVDEGDRVQVSTDRVRLTYDKGPFTTHGLLVEVLGGVTSYHSTWRYGEPTHDLGGTARTLDGADGAIPLEPGVVSRQGFSVIDDSTSFVWGDDGWVASREEGRQDLYVFAYGHDHADAVRALYAVSGDQPVLPRWALGNWWSRYHRYTEASYLQLLDRFAAEGLPFSVAVVDMDWHLVDIDPAYGSGWTGYTWDRELFPDPERFLEQVHRRGLRVTLNVHPADGVRAHEEAYERVARALGRDPGLREPISLDVTDRDFMRVYTDVLHRELEDQGVDFWWVDWQQGTHSRIVGVDPLWVLNHVHFLAAARDGRRPLTFSRYAGPGSHRYPVGFSGDAYVTWATLAFQPYFTATAANIGYGWWSHDVGGHLEGVKDDELATRWVQLGCFSPILRLHSQANPFMTKEPATFGPHAAAVQTRFLRLRQRLVPYLHSMNHRARAQGVPLVTPLYHRWPDEGAAYEHPEQFCFGDALLVAAVTEPADRVSTRAAVPVWLPPGEWVDLLTGQQYDGDRRLVLHRDLDTVPVLAAAGAVVPLDGDEVPGNDPVAPEHVEVLVVVGADGRHELVEDDGTGGGTDESRVTRTAIVWAQAAGELTVEGIAAPYVPAQRRWSVTFVGLPEVTATASVDGEAVEAAVRRADGRTSVVVDAVPAGSRLVVGIGADPRRPRDDVRARVVRVLDDAQCAYVLKAQALEVLEKDVPLGARIAQLHAFEAPRSLESALLEVLTAQG
ncbi:TIM-barrel domain-containing protein [Lapillicoccus jejuensis]|uniref:Alpha-glucosidase (Family GH31 glycosyl hydrolase) n=1 Tax=Lapillicoccus jejuensis TaxID=402171 RepID=A0A542E3I2_9MICO|nr:TIM-barrel domain-containing protein [Lapillicoccus jejuensis]TQJ09898.1 alpha-glucosidase (family GH31 glycosyl hydrolase) [Lapillicoccus jejuensis]